MLCLGAEAWGGFPGPSSLTRVRILLLHTPPPAAQNQKLLPQPVPSLPAPEKGPSAPLHPWQTRSCPGTSTGTSVVSSRTSQASGRRHRGYGGSLSKLPEVHVCLQTWCKGQTLADGDLSSSGTPANAQGNHQSTGHPQEATSPLQHHALTVPCAMPKLFQKRMLPEKPQTKTQNGTDRLPAHTKCNTTTTTRNQSKQFAHEHLQF